MVCAGQVYGVGLHCLAKCGDVLVRHLMLSVACLIGPQSTAGICACLGLVVKLWQLLHVSYNYSTGSDEWPRVQHVVYRCTGGCKDHGLGTLHVLQVDTVTCFRLHNSMRCVAVWQGCAKSKAQQRCTQLRPL